MNGHVTIPLTQGQFAIIDAEDYDRLNQFKWRAKWSNLTRSFYATLTSPLVNGKCYEISMHREVINAPKGKQVDHRDRNTLDNRKSNLQFANHSQNQYNRGKQKHNTSGFKGVSRHPYGKWRAAITVDKKLIHLGLFPDPESAYEAYKTAAFRFHGEFARIS